MSKYKSIVFDTSSLRSENFPEMSAALRQLIEIAESLEIRLCIPDIVLKELEQKFIDDTSEGIGKILGEHKKLKKLVQGKFSLPILEMEDVLSEYEKTVRNLMAANKLTTIPMPSLKADQLVDKAVKRVPPFEGGDKGFRDAMIIESIVEYGVDKDLDDFAFISHDKIFEREEIASSAKLRGINLHVEKKVSDMKERLVELLGSREKEALKEKEKKAMELLETNRDKINEYLGSNFEISEDDLAGQMFGTLGATTLGMVRAKLREIRSAVLEEKGDDKWSISFEGNVEVTMLVESMRGPGVGGVKKYKIGKEPTGPTLREIFELQPVQPMQIRRSVNIKVKGEVEVEEVGGEYRNFSVVYVHPQTEFPFATFGARMLL